MAQAPCRLRRPPRVLMNTASASERRRQRSGASRGRPAGDSQCVEGRPGRAAQRDQPLLGPLAEHPEQAVVALEVGQGQADHLGDPGPGAVEQLEEGPVAQVGGPGAAHRVEQAEHLVLVEGLGQAAGQAGRAQVGGGVAGDGPLPHQEPEQPTEGGGRAGHRRRVPALAAQLGQVALDGLGARASSGSTPASRAQRSQTAMSRR